MLTQITDVTCERNTQMPSKYFNLVLEIRMWIAILNVFLKLIAKKGSLVE